MFKTDHVVVLNRVLFIKGGLGWSQLTSSSPGIIMCASLENRPPINLQAVKIIHHFSPETASMGFWVLLIPSYFIDKVSFLKCKSNHVTFLFKSFSASLFLFEYFELFNVASKFLSWLYLPILSLLFPLTLRS